MSGSDFREKSAADALRDLTARAIDHDFDNCDYFTALCERVETVGDEPNAFTLVMRDGSVYAIEVMEVRGPKR